MMSATILLLIIIIFTTLIFWKRKNKIMQFVKEIPGPPTIPFLGNALTILRHPEGMMSYMLKSQREYGPVTRHWLGPKLQIFISDPNDVEIVLKDTENINKSSLYDIFLSWLGNGIGTTKNKEEWKMKRKIVAPAFYFNVLEKFVQVFNEKGNVLIKVLQKEKSNGYFDMTRYVEMYTFDTILETAFGIHSNQQEQHQKSDYINAVNRMQEIVLIRGFNILLHPSLIFNFTKLGKEQKKLLRIISDYCHKVLKEKKAKMNEVKPKEEEDEIGMKQRYAFLDMLLFAQKNGSGYSDQDVVDEINTFFFGAIDTLSSAMVFCVYHLAKNQDVQEKAYKEITEIFGTSTEDLTIRNIQSCPYIEMFIKETLRITPPVVFFSRNIDTDIKLTNYTIPAGADLNVISYMMHNNPEIYPDPEKFDPERFSAENIRKIPTYAYIPFSGGPRNCVGQKYAIYILKVFIVKILSNFRILLGEDVKGFLNSIILKSSNGVNIKLEKRSNPID